MKKLFTLFLMLAVSAGTLFADKVKIGDLYYNLHSNDQTAAVINMSVNGSSYNGIKSVAIPDTVCYNGMDYSVTTISNNAFRWADSLMSVNIGDNVIDIAPYAFAQCRKLTSISMGNNVIWIESSAFEQCTSLASIILPNTVTYINEKAFWGCSQLSSINIPNSVTRIGEQAFLGCSQLSSINIPNSVTRIGEQAFLRCDSLMSINVAADNPTYCSIEGVLFDIQVTNLIEYPVGKKGEYEIPNSVTTIGGYAFSGCNSLTTIKIPNSVVRIGNYAFSSCYNLTSVTLDAATPPTLVGNPGHFWWCDNLTNIYVPCGTLESYKSAWAVYDSLLHYAPLPSITINVENGTAYTNAGSLLTCDVDSVVYLSAIPNYGYHFVQWSDGNKDNPRVIELTQDTMFTALIEIDKSGVCGKDSALYWSYEDATNSLIISGSGELSEYYYYGIEAPMQAQNLIIGDDVTAIGDSAFYQMATIRTVTFGENVTSIGNYAFAGLNNRNFDELNLPSGILTIGNSAFEGCAYIETIDFGSSLESIGQNAFNGCTRVLSMICLAEITPEVGTNGLTSISSQAELYVQNDFKYRYEIDENWNRFLIKVYQEEQSTIEAIFSEEGSTTSQKVFSDGQILILREGKVYTTTGHEVK